ncbi:MAG TPA: GxxExxY protein, partial [Rhizomicrobium sp.]|nr:GxxExxY protein [Rhizomicrobium sp.]
MVDRPLDDITGAIVDAAYKIHCVLGPGLLESVYEVILLRNLERRGLRAARQVPVSFGYDGMQFNDVCRVDMLVEGCVVVELKSVERLAPVHPKQLLTYLRLLKLPVGLLINLGAPTLKDVLRRIVNALPPSASPREQTLTAVRSARVRFGLCAAGFAFAAPLAGVPECPQRQRPYRGIADDRVDDEELLDRQRKDQRDR